MTVESVGLYEYEGKKFISVCSFYRLFEFSIVKNAFRCLQSGCKCLLGFFSLCVCRDEKAHGRTRQIIYPDLTES